MDEITAIDVDRIDITPVNKKENRTLYAKRVKVHPRQVTGTFRRLKWLVMVATLAIYYLVPWLRWDRGAGAPDQAVLIDFPARRFYFFFIEIWPQEIYYITGLLIMAALALFLVTTVAGRAWCGYACPQTVWTDLFITVERFIEGDRNARIRLDKAPLSLTKFAKRSAKFAVWLVIALCTGGAWVFYFADAPTLMGQILTFSAPLTATVTIGILTFTTFLLGGFAREQICTYMCPWPRIQGAMMDEDSLIVTYRDYRGETRGPHKMGDDWVGRGDCIDCNQCIAACPAGIDIRDGQQLECISCALCIDACNGVMEKVGRPRNLIAYDTFLNTERQAAGRVEEKSLATRLIRPRTVIYGALWALVGLIMLYVLINRPNLEVNVLHDRNPMFVRLADGSIRNGYTVKILNKAYQGRNFTLSVEGLPGAAVAIVGVGVADGAAPLAVERDRLRSFRIYVTLPPATAKGEARDIAFVLTEEGSDATARYDSIFRGPGS